jgi:cytoskeletal protein CcmA (bactofilin family)
MEETLIRAGQSAKVGTVQGDLRAENHALIQPSEGSRVIVIGQALFEGSVEVDSDIECGSLRSRDGLVRVNGHLIIHEDIDVEEALYARGTVKAKKIDVGGRLSVGQSLEAQRADVGGSLEVQGSICADSVDVGGSLEVLGGVVLKDLETGGRVDVGGGEVSGGVDVGGTFASHKLLRFDRIEVGGTIELAGGEGRLIDVGGRLQSNGDLKCDQLDVGGFVDVEGSFSGRRAEVGGRIKVSGDLLLSERLEVGGSAEIGGVLSGADVEVGGQLKASKGLLSGRAEVGGILEAPQGFKASVIELGKEAKCVGTLVGGSVHIRKHSQIQDVYCSQLVVEGGTKLGKVYAESAEFGDACVVEGLVYTRELREGARVVYLTPPQKSTSLPPFPL